MDAPLRLLALMTPPPDPDVKADPGRRDLVMAGAVPFVWGMGLVFSKAVVDQFPPTLLMALR